MATSDERREYLDSLSEMTSANARPEWPEVRQAARDRAETALLAMFGEKLPDKKGAKKQR